MSNPPTADALRRQMQAIRRQLPADVEQIVEGARELVDWRSTVRKHPWATAALTAAAGYWLVPRKSPAVPVDPQAWAEVLKAQKWRVEQRPRSGLLGTLLGAAGTLALRAGTNYVTQQLTRPRPAGGTAPDWEETTA